MGIIYALKLQRGKVLIRIFYIQRYSKINFLLYGAFANIYLYINYTVGEGIMKTSGQPGTAHCKNKLPVETESGKGVA
jgi:hypothetical protein